MAEFGLGIAVGGDDVLDAEQGGEADGLDDVRRAVDVWRGGIEQIGVRAEGGELEACGFGHGADLGGVGIEADRCGEAIFHAQRSAVVVVGDVGVFNAELADRLKLPCHPGERFNQCKTSYLHPVRSFGFWNMGISYHENEDRSFQSGQWRILNKYLLVAS